MNKLKYAKLVRIYEYLLAQRNDYEDCREYTQAFSYNRSASYVRNFIGDEVIRDLRQRSKNEESTDLSNRLAALIRSR